MFFSGIHLPVKKAWKEKIHCTVRLCSTSSVDSATVLQNEREISDDISQESAAMPVCRNVDRNAGKNQTFEVVQKKEDTAIS